MARNYRHTLFNDAVKALQERHGSRAAYLKMADDYLTGMRARLATRTPLIHGQDTLDAWISALVASNSRIGMLPPRRSDSATTISSTPLLLTRSVSV